MSPIFPLSNFVLCSLESTENMEILRRTGQVILQLPPTVVQMDDGAFALIELCRCEACRGFLASGGTPASGEPLEVFV